MTAQTPRAEARPPADSSASPAQPAGEPSRRRGAVRRLGAGLREVIIVVVAALVVSLLVKAFVMQAFLIPSPSMQDTLTPGDRVVVSELTPGPFALHRGDVVVFADPGGWLDGAAEGNQGQRTGSRSVLARGLTTVGLLPDPSTGHLIKRVIGLPGDTVTCCTADGSMTINGTPVREDYLAAGAVPSQVAFSVTVPRNHVWVEGDNRQNSRDSRFHQNLPGGGTVDEHLIVGRAVARAWPPDRVGWLSDHPDVFASVPARR